MNYREIFYRTLNLDNPRFILADLGGRVNSFTVQAYKNFLEYLNIDYEEENINMSSRITVKDVDEKILQELGIGFRRVFINSLPGDYVKNPDGSITDMWGITRKAYGYYSEIVDNPLSDADIDDLERYNWPDFKDERRVEGLEAKAKYLKENTDYIVVAGGPTAGLFGISRWLRGFENFLVDMKINEAFAIKLVEKVFEKQIELFDLLLGSIGKYIDMIETGDDFGMQIGLLFSPETYRTILKPYHKELLSFIKSKTNAKILHHSCGAVSELIDELIDVGVDILNPIQPKAIGMQPEKLVKFKGKICFHGGVDMQSVLPDGTPAQVRSEVTRYIETLGIGGGFIVSPSHNIQPDVPPENILALYETVKKYNQNVLERM